MYGNQKTSECFSLLVGGLGRLIAGLAQLLTAKKQKAQYVFVFCSVVACCVCAAEQPVDTIIALPLAHKDVERNPYDDELLTAVLEETRAEFGPYRIQLPVKPMMSSRALLELGLGDHLHVIISTYKETWEGKTIVVPFPVNKGLASYRFFYANKKNARFFSEVTNIEQLRTYKFGQGRDWSTIKVLEDSLLDVVTFDSYDGVFSMLKADRFQLLMRGAQEIVLEENRVAKYEKDIYIEDNFCFYIYLPLYFQVSVKRPDLAKRLELGLKRLDGNGTVEALLKKYNFRALALVKNTTCKAIYLENTNLKPGAYRKEKAYLLKQH